jgi:hypothetical protein
MAYTTVLLTNGVEVKKAPIGFSWTVLCFGGWPALFRQDWIWGFGLLIAGLLTYGLAGVVAAFFYNKVYAKTLFDDGYRVHSLPPDITEEGLKNYLGYLTLPTKA